MFCFVTFGMPVIFLLKSEHDVLGNGTGAFSEVLGLSD